MLIAPLCVNFANSQKESSGVIAVQFGNRYFFSHLAAFCVFGYGQKSLFLLTFKLPGAKRGQFRGMWTTWPA
jgi:hypothetical protein